LYMDVPLSIQQRIIYHMQFRPLQVFLPDTHHSIMI
jgi:hypothetical protein